MKHKLGHHCRIFSYSSSG